MRALHPIWIEYRSLRLNSFRLWQESINKIVCCMLIGGRHGSLEVVDLLLTRNPGLTCKNNAGETPLHVAAKSHDASAALVRRIVDAVIKTETWSLLDEPDRFHFHCCRRLIFVI